MNAPFAYLPNAEYEVTFRSFAGLLRLTSSSSGASSKSIELLLSQTSEQMIGAMAGCDGAILAPAETSHPVFDLINDLHRLSERQVISQADQEGSCPREMEAWISFGLELPLDDWGRGDSSSLWSDETTRTVLGKPFRELSVGERQAYYRALVARCGVGGDRRRRSVIGLLSRLTDYRSFRDQKIEVLMQQGIQDWYRGYETLVAADPMGGSIDLEESRELQRIPLMFGGKGDLRLPDVDSEAYRREVAALIAGGLKQLENELFLSELAGAQGNFLRLLALYERAVADPQLDLAAAEKQLETDLLPAAELFASAVQDPDDALMMLGWLADWPSRTLCDELLRRSCKSIQRRFEERLDGLTEAWAEQSFDEFDALERRPASLEQLADGITAQDALMARYGALLKWNDFTELWDEYDSWIIELQNDLKHSLTEAVKAVRTAPELRRVEALYLRPGDIERRDMRGLRREMSAQWEASRPFVDTGADAYLNAIHSQDFAVLRRLDAQLLANVRPAFALLANQTAMLGQLATGGQGNAFSAVTKELLSPTAMRIVAMEYLLNYESRYGDCLASGAVDFTFTERRDLVTRSSSGLELSRIEGVTTSTSYRVKPALVDLFRESFSPPSGGIGSDRFFNLLLGDSGISDLRDGVKTLMGRYECGSPEMQGFEAGLVAYQRELGRRWRA
ncbi:MAG: hypothetical protein Cons2KO_20260 [Congregibacter sp.]